MFIDWSPTLSGGESVAIILATVVSVGGNVAQWVRGRRSKPRPVRFDLELIPIYYSISINPGTIATALVLLRAVNYGNKPLRLTQVRVRFLQVSGAPSLTEIVASDPYEIGAKQSRDVWCRRTLVEAEASQVRAAALSAGPFSESGSVMVGGSGICGKRPVSYEPGASFVIRGVIQGAASATVG